MKCRGHRVVIGAIEELGAQLFLWLDWGDAAPIPGRALREKGLQRQQGVGPLVNSQERKTAVVPLFNRSSTGYQPVVNQ